MGTVDIEHRLDAIVLPPETQARCLALVDQVFDLYDSFVDELLAFARSHSIEGLRAGGLGPGRNERAEFDRPRLVAAHVVGRA
jgi:hypothetical protein